MNFFVPLHINDLIVIACFANQIFYITYLITKYPCSIINILVLLPAYLFSYFLHLFFIIILLFPLVLVVPLIKNNSFILAQAMNSVPNPNNFIGGSI
jgi:hypothetical protein